MGEMLVSYRESALSEAEVTYKHLIHAPVFSGGRSNTTATGAAAAAGAAGPLTGVAQPAITVSLSVEPLIDANSGVTTGSIPVEVILPDSSAQLAEKNRMAAAVDKSKKSATEEEEEEEEEEDADEDGAGSTTTSSSSSSSLSGDGQLSRKFRVERDEAVQRAIEEGVLRDLCRGPTLGYPMTALRVKIHKVVVSGAGCSAHPLATGSSGAGSMAVSPAGSGTGANLFTSSQFSIAAARAVKEAIKQATPVLLEPGMC